MPHLPSPSVPSSSLLHRLRRTLRTPLGVTALTACIVLAVVAVLGPMLFGAEADRVDTNAIDQGSSMAHLLGTDDLGRDIAARVVVATRLSLELTLQATVIGVVGGLLLGVAPTVLGRRLGRLVTATVGVLVAFPGLLFVLFLATVFGVGSTGAMFAIGVATVPSMARLVQNMTASIAGSDYVAAARILGVGRFRLVSRHLLPNIAEPSALFATQAAAGILLSFSGLSFLGLGVQAPQYDWGRLLNEQLNGIYVNPVAALAPGVAVVLTGLTFGLVGEVFAKASGRRAPLSRQQPPSEQSAMAPAPLPDESAEGALVQVHDLRVGFPDGREAVRGVSLTIGHGEALGLVGESGSGKSLTALALADLVPHPGRVQAAEITFDGHDLRSDPHLGTTLAMVFQDPMASLNPALRVGRQLSEVAEVHLGSTRAQARARAVDRLSAVRIPSAARRARQRPHEYSGGMRQRAVIAMGLMGEPKLVIADEPTTALDVTVQQQVLDLLAEVRTETGAALLLISHDLAVVAQVCERVLVMYAGRIVEDLPVAELVGGAAHPYTRALVGAIPTMTTDPNTELATIPGRPPEPGDADQGCSFAPRCALATDRCRSTRPELVGFDTGRRVACWHPVGAVLPLDVRPVDAEAAS
ncbi:dipeptide/oligopeptide/nickel ABC transporter permease/ATP-binding protein [Streptacidiphilus jiangxiensis]|uniref:Oligopeptide/dipeptide ABC transporter, ATP-binding protein, C-terminal domain-containing protein n=1 Tax=Streptacidiphilus jiangxiensis TaxID=235985 RepID=A0A1H7X9N8_STRJI|nr:dipeptide/oligopeptide/nickel ABC transporter permease/ATP-binding protein [Streptacidiphilus jiangxiensis]SEM29848.1 oligopeptide/dipeptide ABC transporter, ATP-binding protein, C-terminal domain-containing protein [Streptacidiphilus jiangxiensis]